MATSTTMEQKSFKNKSQSKYFTFLYSETNNLQNQILVTLKWIFRIMATTDVN